MSGLLQVRLDTCVTVLGDRGILKVLLFKEFLMSKRIKAFTLIELLVVIAII